MAGTFDPLTAYQARRLASYANADHKLLVVVQSQGENLLPADARAILVAALREVHAVTFASTPEDYSALKKYKNVEMVSDPEGECRRTSEFRDFVIRRQSA